MLAQAPLVLHACLCTGNTGAAKGAAAFVSEALALLPADWKLLFVCAESGFFEDTLLSYLEQPSLTYLVVARLTLQLKRQAAAISTWQAVDEHDAAGGFTAQLLGRSAPRRFVVVRETLREGRASVGAQTH